MAAARKRPAVWQVAALLLQPLLLGPPWLLGLLTGAALLLSFPPLNWHGVAWVAIAPLIAALQARPAPRLWLGAGWGLGLVFYAGQYTWLARALVQLGGVGVGAFSLFTVTLVVVLALLPALALALCAWLRARWGMHAACSVPLAWAGQDWLLNFYPFDGVAWGSLAGPQGGTVSALLAPLAGGSSMVLLLAAANGAWAWWLSRAAWLLEAARLPLAGRAAGYPGAPAQAGPRLTAGPTAGPAMWPAVWLAMGVVLAGATLCLAWPCRSECQWPGQPADEQEPAFAALLVPGRLAVVQPTVAQPTVAQGAGTPAPDAQASAALRELLARSMAALGQQAAQPAPARPRLVIWPESAVPGHVSDGDALPTISGVGTLQDADFLLGSDSADPGREHNSLYLVQGRRFDFTRYDKRSRVPFGEYVPWGFGWLFGRKLTAGERDYAAGTQPPVLDWRGLPLGVATCFESILPRHTRLAAAQGARVLVVAANDAWLTPSAQQQHLALTALRGREIGRDVLFVSNGGSTGLLRGGRAESSAQPGDRPLWVEAHPTALLTPWVRWGEGPLAGAMLLLGAAGWALRRRR